MLHGCSQELSLGLLDQHLLRWGQGQLRERGQVREGEGTKEDERIQVAREEISVMIQHEWDELVLSQHFIGFDRCERLSFYLRDDSKTTMGY